MPGCVLSDIIPVIITFYILLYFFNYSLTIFPCSYVVSVSICKRTGPHENVARSGCFRAGQRERAGCSSFSILMELAFSLRGWPEEIKRWTQSEPILWLIRKFINGTSNLKSEAKVRFGGDLQLPQVQKSYFKSGSTIKGLTFEILLKYLTWGPLEADGATSIVAGQGWPTWIITQEIKHLRGGTEIIQWERDELWCQGAGFQTPALPLISYRMSGTLCASAFSSVMLASTDHQNS